MSYFQSLILRYALNNGKSPLIRRLLIETAEEQEKQRLLEPGAQSVRFPSLLTFFFCLQLSRRLLYSTNWHERRSILLWDKSVVTLNVLERSWIWYGTFRSHFSDLWLWSFFSSCSFPCYFWTLILSVIVKRRKWTLSSSKKRWSSKQVLFSFLSLLSLIFSRRLQRPSTSSQAT